MKNLTEKQEHVLNFIREYQLKYGASPTLREMREELGVSSDNSILKHLNALEVKGFIDRRDDGPRSINLLTSVKQRLEQPAKIKLPVMGEIPAGGPVFSEEYIEQWMSVGEDVVYRSKDSFLLRVRGDSMIDAGILEEDLVVVCSQLEPKVNDIVVALVDGQNTVKRLAKEKASGCLFLQPENKEYSPIYPEGILEIQGVVTGLIRTYK